MSRDWTATKAPSLDDVERIARRAYDELPEAFRALTGEMLIRIADFPEDDALAALDLDSPLDLLGLFQGVGMAHGSAAPFTGQLPNAIWLYRRPILDYWCETEETLEEIITHVLIHEIGHHFGLSDDDMEAIEAAAS